MFLHIDVYVQKHFWKNNCFVRSMFSCVRVSCDLVCARTRAQLRENIGCVVFSVVRLRPHECNQNH